MIRYQPISLYVADITYVRNVEGQILLFEFAHRCILP